MYCTKSLITTLQAFTGTKVAWREQAAKRGTEASRGKRTRGIYMAQSSCETSLSLIQYFN